jgi:hypothetical protein
MMAVARQRSNPLSMAVTWDFDRAKRLGVA